MRKLLEIGNRYAKESTWKDFALVKFCLFAMGLAAGTQVPDKYNLYFLFFSHSIHILRATGVSGRSFLQPYMNP